MEIRQIQSSEISLIHDFLDNHWKAGHSLRRSESLLDFQHLENNQFNFFAAIQDNTVWALQGFIPTTIYDASLCKGDAWGAIWKIREDAPDKMLGIELQDRITREYGFTSIGAIGISGMAQKVYRLLSWNSGFLHQYYIANDYLSSYSILKCEERDNRIHIPPKNWHIETCVSLSDLPHLSAEYYKPLKSISYFINRYERHPIYKYLFWCIFNGSILKSIWAIRRIVVNGISLFRIVDVLGRIEEFPDIYCCIQEILKKESAEYVDFLNYGIPPDVFGNMGFREVDFLSDKVICPNYFEPYESRNVMVHLAYKSKGEYVCFKGDADQDRPSIL